MSAVPMKDSGVAWLGEIPDHWKLVRFDAILSERNEKNTKLNTANILSLMKDVGVIRYKDKGNIGNKSSDRPENYKLVYPNDLVLNSMNLFIGSVGISREFGVTSSVYIICYPKDSNVYVEYYHGLVRDKGFQTFIGSIGNGIMEIRRAVKYKNLKVQLIPLPPLTEQRAIAAYLDRETAKIDALIAKTEQLNALLGEKRTALISHTVTKGIDPSVELKDSGVEWLGEIPSKWLLSQLSAVAEVIAGQSPPSSTYNDEGLGLPFFQGKAEFGERFPAVLIWCSEPQRISEMGDVLVSVRAPVGDVNITPYECCIGRGLAAIRVKEKGFNIYLYYALMHAGSYLAGQGTGSTFESINKTILQAVPFPLPPLAEQRAIAEHLDRETARIDALSAKNARLIALLREKRSALISAAVTGKIDLRNEA